MCYYWIGCIKVYNHDILHNDKYNLHLHLNAIIMRRHICSQWQILKTLQARQTALRFQRQWGACQQFQSPPCPICNQWRSSGHGQKMFVQVWNRTNNCLNYVLTNRCTSLLSNMPFLYMTLYVRDVFRHCNYWQFVITTNFP